MSRLDRILDPRRIRLHVEAASKKRALELAGMLFEEVDNLSRSIVTESLLARERLGSTGLGKGVAIPHGRIKGLKTPMAAVLQLDVPIPFLAPDDIPVSLLYCLLVPESATQEHLDILSQIIKILRIDEVREKLLAATDVQTFYQLAIQNASMSTS